MGIGYVIRQIRPDGTMRFVARSGSEHSYTKFLQYARVWREKGEAERHLCEHDQIASIEEVMFGDEF